MRGLTVLQVAYPFAPVNADPVGGAEQVAAALDRAVVEAGGRSVVVACEGSEVAGELIAVPSVDGPIDETAKARVHAAVREALAAIPADVVHLHGVDAAAYLPDPARAPVVVSLHLPPGWYPKALLTRGDLRLVPVSRSQAAAAPPGARLSEPIPNGVDLDGWPDRPRSDRLLMLGRICPEKGQVLALEAARRVDAPLDLAGEVFAYAAHRDYFEREVKPRLDARRRFVGPLSGAAKRAAIAQARAVLIPSLAPETASLVAMEAAAAGTPVVAFARGALPETVEHGVTGFVVEDLDAMVAALSRLDEIEPSVCRARARARFDRRVMTDRWMALYAALAGAEGDVHGRLARA